MVKSLNDTRGYIKAWDYATGNDVTPERVIKEENDVMRIYMEGRDLIFAFDPSNDLQDWLSNVKFCTEKEITRCVMRFAEKVEAYVDALTKHHLFFLGYSRGAALATKMCGHIAASKDRFCVCRAFESPAIMSRGGADIYDNYLPTDHITFRNGRDPVTYLPCNLCHVGSMFTMPQPWYMMLPGIRAKTHYPASVRRALVKKYGGERYRAC